MISRCLGFGLLLCMLCVPTHVPAQPGPGFPGQPPRPPRVFHVPTPEEKEAARQRIGITVQQQSQIDELYKDSGVKRRAIRDEIHDLYDQRRALYDSFTLDTTKERELRAAIIKQQRKMLDIENDTEVKLRTILNKEQFGKLRQMMREMMARDHGPNPHFKRGEGPGPTAQ